MWNPVIFGVKNGHLNVVKHVIDVMKVPMNTILTVSPFSSERGIIYSSDLIEETSEVLLLSLQNT